MIEMGKLGTFVWFFGVVEDVDDPLQVGRVRVRPYNFYTTNSTLLPTEDLPWAHVVMPNTSASFNEKGASPTFLMVGATVFGFFADDGSAQMPVILGSYPGIPQPNPDFVDSQNLTTDNHDVNRLARGVNKLNEAKSQVGIDSFEPPPNVTFGARYPFNKVFESERGHVVEFDDTPGNERIHIYHNAGHYTEMVAGMRTDKVNGDHIEISMRDRYIKVNGNMAVIVEGTTTIASKGAVAISSEKQISMVAPIINISASLGLTMSGGASLSATATVSTVTGMLGLFLNPGIGLGT